MNIREQILHISNLTDHTVNNSTFNIKTDRLSRREQFLWIIDISLSLSLSSCLWIIRRWYMADIRRNYIWSNIPLPSTSPNLKFIKLKLWLVIAAKQLKCGLNPNWLNKQIKEFSCYSCFQVFLFSHISCVCNRKAWERRLPGALASFPPITSNVTSLFSFLLPLSFYLTISALTAAQYPLPLLCLSLSVSLSFCPWAET